MEKIYVFGHRKPDTDSVGGAIALAYLKKQLGINAIPVILSNINSETKYALDYFNLEEPMFLNDVKLKIKDLNYSKNFFINEDKSLLEAYNLMVSKKSSKIPVVGENNNFIGVLGMKNIAKYLINYTNTSLNTTYNNILNTIEGEKVTLYNEDIEGNVIVASYKSTTFIDNVTLDNSSILIVGDRHSIIEYAVNSNIKLLIISGGVDIKKEHLKIAKQNKINIMRTKLSAIQTARMIELANKINSTEINKNILCVNELDNVTDFIDMANRTKFSYYPVVNKNNKCLGTVTLADTFEKKKKKVILVDHNSYTQSIEGIEEADILEIIDHHNIGSIGTNSPINFRNMPVGSSNTIIYQMYKENGIKIPKQIAGIMASGILSDTLILKSPTTTELDKKALTELSKLAKINYNKYGLDLLKAGASVKGKTKEELLYQDFKIYPVGDKKIGIGQISTTDPSIFLNEKDEYEALLTSIAKNNEYKSLTFFVNDILNDGSYIFFNDDSKEILANAFNIKKLEQGTFLKKVVSRKLQIVPVIMEQYEK